MKRSSVQQAAELTFVRDAGTCLIYRFGFVAGQELRAIHALLRALEPNQEVSVPDPENKECSREVRNQNNQLEIKRGCQGAYGTWSVTTFEEATRWLLPGAEFAAQKLKKGYGGLLTVSKQ